jgi:hypothetical protein
MPGPVVLASEVPSFLELTLRGLAAIPASTSLGTAARKNAIHPCSRCPSFSALGLWPSRESRMAPHLQLLKIGIQMSASSSSRSGGNNDMTNTELAQHISALIFQSLKEPIQPASVHDVKPGDFMKSGQSIWKYRDGVVFRLEIGSEKQGYKLLKAIKPTDYEWSEDKKIMVVLWNEADLNTMITEARLRWTHGDPEHN